MVAGMTARAAYRGYVQDGKRSSRVTRLHILRDDSHDRRQFWCGQSAWPHQRSVPVILDPAPLHPPAGLRWCPACVGHLAERLGLLDDVAGEVVSYDPGLTDLHAEKWWELVGTQREVRRNRLLSGEQ